MVTEGRGKVSSRCGRHEPTNRSSEAVGIHGAEMVLADVGNWSEWSNPIVSSRSVLATKDVNKTA